jgi:hypothetical protein
LIAFPFIPIAAVAHEIVRAWYNCSIKYHTKYYFNSWLKSVKADLKIIKG